MNCEVMNVPEKRIEVYASILLSASCLRKGILVTHMCLDLIFFWGSEPFMLDLI